MPFVSNISRMHSYSSVSISTQWLMQTNCKAHNNESVTNIYTHQKTKYRNTTGPPCSCGAIIRLEATWRHRPAFAGEAACRQTVECYRRRQMTTTDTSDRNYYGPNTCVGGPVIKCASCLNYRGSWENTALTDLPIIRGQWSDELYIMPSHNNRLFLLLSAYRANTPRRPNAWTSGVLCWHANTLKLTRQTDGRTDGRTDRLAD